MRPDCHTVLIGDDAPLPDAIFCPFIYLVAALSTIYYESPCRLVPVFFLASDRASLFDVAKLMNYGEINECALSPGLCISTWSLPLVADPFVPLASACSPAVAP